VARSLRAGHRRRLAVEGPRDPASRTRHSQGYHKDVDSYSAFTEADGKTTTGLAAYLKARKLERLFVAGLATDFCVAWTALDARKAGFEAYVVEDACRGIDTQGSMAKAWADMTKAGVKRIQSSDIAV
jgi:nicotinamidase/pyrazinamidase